MSSSPSGRGGRAVRVSLRAVALLALALPACGGPEAKPSFAGHWTSRPTHHSESKEAVEFFGEAAVQRMHDAGNSMTPPLDLDLLADGRFEAHGRLTPSTGDE